MTMLNLYFLAIAKITLVSSSLKHLGNHMIGIYSTFLHYYAKYPFLVIRNGFIGSTSFIGSNWKAKCARIFNCPFVVLFLPDFVFLLAMFLFRVNFTCCPFILAFTLAMFHFVGEWQLIELMWGNSPCQLQPRTFSSSSIVMRFTYVDKVLLIFSIALF